MQRFSSQVGSVGIGPGTQIHNYYGLKVRDWIRITERPVQVAEGWQAE